MIDDIKAFDSGGTNNGMPEAALLGKKRQQAGWGNFLPCSTRSRGSSPMVSGDITDGGEAEAGRQPEAVGRRRRRGCDQGPIWL